MAAWVGEFHGAQVVFARGIAPVFFECRGLLGLFGVALGIAIKREKFLVFRFLLRDHGRIGGVARVVEQLRSLRVVLAGEFGSRLIDCLRRLRQFLVAKGDRLVEDRADDVIARLASIPNRIHFRLDRAGERVSGSPAALLL